MRRKIVIFFIIFIAITHYNTLLQAHEKITDIVKYIKPAVVTINTYDERGNIAGQGTGFFVGEGQIISTRHVFEGTSNAKIKTSDGAVYSILGVIADDEKWDLILLKTEIPDNKIKPLLITEKYPQEGQKIVVVGSPRGFEQTVSDGIISSIRIIPNTGKIIQITAPISPGSSGSPVVNLKGEVVGVAALQMRHAQQLNFAVPAEHIFTLNNTELKTLAQWSHENKKENLDNNIFEDSSLGYKIEYPYDWIYEKISQYKVIFSGKPGTEAYYSTVNIQNVASKKIGGSFDNMASVIKDFKKQILMHGENAKFYDERKIIYKTKGGNTLSGEEFITEYTKAGENFKQWQIFTPSYNGEIFYVWVYTSPIEQYDTYLETAKKMLNSWEIK